MTARGALPSVMLLLHVLGLDSAQTPPSGCDELRLENQRLRELVDRLSALRPEWAEADAPGEGPGAVRGTGRALLWTNASAVIQGKVNTNVCPIGSAVISSPEECEKAGALLGYDYYTTHLEPDWPKGCYLYAGYAYFNAHPVGSANPYARIVCYLWTAAPTPAPTRIGDTISPTTLPTTEGAAYSLCHRRRRMIRDGRCIVGFCRSMQRHAADGALVRAGAADGRRGTVQERHAVRVAAQRQRHDRARRVVDGARGRD